MSGNSSTSGLRSSFVASDPAAAVRWLRLAASRPRAALVQERVTRREDAYFDTEDERFRRWGYALRLSRGDEGITAALEPVDGTLGPPASKAVLEAELEAADIRRLLESQDPLAGIVRAVAGQRPLRRVAGATRLVYRFSLTAPGESSSRIEVVELSARRRAGRSSMGRGWVIVDAADSDRPALEPVLQELAPFHDAAAGAQEAVENIFAALGFDPPWRPEVGDLEVNAFSSVGEVAFAVLRKHFLAMVRHEPGTRAGLDAEALHDMRVATRRLRAAIALFSDVLPVRVKALRKRLGAVGRRLGEVRDLDVQLEQLAEWTETLEADDRTALQGIARLLLHRRERARARMLRLLDSPSFERLQSSMVRLLRQGPSRRAPARARILDVAPPLIARRYRKVRTAGDPLTSDSPAAAYHVLRIQCKRLRYALEFHADVYGEVVRSMIERLVVLQDLLGEHQDAQVAIAHIGELCAGIRPRLAPRAMFVLGRVAERYSRNAADLRAAFPKAYRRIRGRRFRPLLESLDQRRLEVPP